MQGCRVACLIALSVGTCAGAVERGAQTGRVQQDLTQIRANPIVSLNLVRSALLDLGLQKVPSPDDYQLACELLWIASQLDPTNADTARLVVESAWSAGDLDTMILATRRVIACDPKDTVAQLRLVSSIINTKQTVEERLALYARFLGESGSSLDDSVRSRLALDAALLERERGNAQGFVERLHLATKLDESNKSAASLAAQYYGQMSSDPVSWLEYQRKLLYADPLDPNVHLTIARILAREGAFAPAERFLKNATYLFELETGRPPSMIEELRFAMKWQIEGPKSVLDELNPILYDRRAEAQARIDSYIEAQLPLDDLIKPIDIRYDIGIDKIRLLAAFNTDDVEMTQRIIDDIELSVKGTILSIGNQLGERGADKNALLSQLVASIADFQVMRAMVELETDEIRTDIDEIVKNLPMLEPYFAAIEPLTLYAEGKHEESLAMILRLKSTVVLQMIEALSHEKLGNRDLAINRLNSIFRNHSLNAYGAFARSRLIKMGVGDQTLSTAGKQMIQISGTIPNWIDQMNSRVTTFMSLDIVSPAPVIDALDEPMITIRLKNISPIPLAVGSSHPIDSRFLIVPRIDDQSAGFSGKVVSKVVQLNHRLRLRPLEEMVVRVPAESVQSQWILKMQSNVSIRERWRVLQGFRPRVSDDVLKQSQSPQGASIYGIVNSPLGLTAESMLVQRLALLESSFTPEQLVTGLQSDDLNLARRALIACAGRLVLPATGKAFTLAQQSIVIDALIEMYTHASSEQRAEMVLLLPHRHQVSEMIAFDDHVVRLLISDALIDSVVDPVVLASVLLTRTDAADSPVFDVLEQTQDPRLARIAQVIQSRLERNEVTYSTVGPGVGSMLPVRDQFGP